jgi:DNA replication protein DnaC
VLDRKSIYRSTNIQRLIELNPHLEKKYMQVLGMDIPNGRGLVIHGHSGSGKTRICWMLMKRLHDTGRRVAGYTATDLGNAIGAAFADMKGARFVDNLKNLDVLMIDDIDKVVPTTRVKAELFSIVESICGVGSLIVTTNVGSDVLSERWSGGPGDPTVRRIVEFCESVYFPKR